MAGYLRRRGETVVTASSYRQGLQALEDDAVPIDILITDGRMPDGSGIDLLRAAIERPGGPHAFILMTGHFEESDLTADLREAGVVVIYKPFSLAALYRAGGRRLGRPLPDRAGIGARPRCQWRQPLVDRQQRGPAPGTAKPARHCKLPLLAGLARSDPQLRESLRSVTPISLAFVSSR